MARHRKQWYITKTISHSVRRWLNPLTYVRGYHSQGGFIMTRLGTKKGKRYDCGASLRIADCSRSIDIDLELGSPADRDRSVKKLKILEEEIGMLRRLIQGMEYEKL